MAIYYIDPFGTVNGTGTWASPWVLGNITRTGLASGDEIRIIGQTLSSLLTATTYTATVTNGTTLTITAGGGLGADWSIGDMGYLPEFDTFFRILTKPATDQISVYASSVLPINNTSVTSVTLKRLDTVSNIIPNRTNAYIGGAAANISNITVSDCWINETTRVTDGTVKTLITCLSNSNMNVYLDTSSRNNTSSCTNWTLNLQNTHIVSGGVTTGTAGITPILYADNSVYNIKQIYYTTTDSRFNIGNQNVGAASPTINITHQSQGFLSNAVYADNLIANIENIYCYYADPVISSGTGLLNCTNYNITINYISNLVMNSGNIVDIKGVGVPKGIINLVNMVDGWTSSAHTALIGGGCGNVTLNIAAGFTIKNNRRAGTQSTLLRGYNTPWYNNIAKMIVPTINNLSTIITTNLYYFGLFSFATGYAYGPKNYLNPSIMEFNCPSNVLAANLPNAFTSANVLMTYRDDSSPLEILGVITNSSATNLAANSCPQVTLDSSVYRTTGPSLKSYLATRTSSYWVPSPAFPRSVAVKNIKIPVTSGVTYAISGWVRTDDTAYLTGDCRIAIVYNNAELVGQNMTTACINAWEQFTLTFTATQTCEMTFAWVMYYANGAKSYWLDDLTIS